MVMLVLDVVIAFFGLYMVVTALQMKKTGKINEILLAKDEYKKCKDEQGFITFFYWREALYGACVLLVGILGILDKTVWKLGKLNYVEVLIILAGYVWFQHSLNQARDQFFRKF